MLEDKTVTRLVSRSASPVPGWDGFCAPASSPLPIQELRIARGSCWPSAAPSVVVGPP
jgi:hypothetical protein